MLITGIENEKERATCIVSNAKKQDLVSNELKFTQAMQTFRKR